MDVPFVMTMVEVSEFARVPVATLRSYRQRGLGPRGFPLAGRVHYLRDDVLRWVTECSELPEATDDRQEDRDEQG